MEMILKNRICSLGIVLVSIISTGIFMQSCSNDFDSFSDVTMVDSQKANYIVLEYMELIGNQYVLNLSEDAALALGISKFDYDRIQTDIRQANASIIECQENGIEVDFNDFKNNQIDIQSVRLKSGNENNNGNGNGNNKPTGYFVMPETGAGGSCSIFAPNGKTKVVITATTPCFISTCSGSISCGGTTIPYSITGFGGGSTTKDLPMSNTSVSVSGSTLCSGGGTVTVSFK
jgi:hypothetical protein